MASIAFLGYIGYWIARGYEISPVGNHAVKSDRVFGRWKSDSATSKTWCFVWASRWWNQLLQTVMVGHFLKTCTAWKLLPTVFGSTPRFNCLLVIFKKKHPNLGVEKPQLPFASTVRHLLLFRRGTRVDGTADVGIPGGKMNDPEKKADIHSNKNWDVFFPPKQLGVCLIFTCSLNKVKITLRYRLT